MPAPDTAATASWIAEAPVMPASRSRSDSAAAATASWVRLLPALRSPNSALPLFIACQQQKTLSACLLLLTCPLYGTYLAACILWVTWGCNAHKRRCV